jgi:hypothetical protein
VLRWNLRARFRAQSLPVPRSLPDIVRADIATAALLSLAWAALPEAAGIASPEALADLIEAEPDGLDRLDEAFSAALKIAYPKPNTPEADAKKTEPNSLPAPGSSSG